MNPHSPSPPLKSEAAPGRRPGTTSLLMMDVVTRIMSRYKWCRWSYCIHARKRPSRPANAEIRPDCGKALSGPLRRRTKASALLSAGFSLAGGRDGLLEPINNVTGCAGLRRHSLTVPYSIPAGASMPLKRHSVDRLRTARLSGMHVIGV